MSDALRTWVEEKLGVSALKFEALAPDAGFRRYFRVTYPASDQSLATRIAVNAPPETEQNQAFVDIGAYLLRSELRVPKVIDSDLGLGFLLLEDFGQVLLSERLSEETASQYYQDSMALLLHMSVLSKPPFLPDYTEQLLQQELGLFPEWCLNRLIREQVGSYNLNAWNKAWPELSRLLIESALAQPQVFVHRDFHSKNLMCLEDGSLGMLDFQDAVWGPFTYDLVSLLKDRYIHWPRDKVNEWALDYHYRWQKLQQQLGQSILQTEVQVYDPSKITKDAFLIAFDLMGLQRHIKMLGIFSRLWLRDQKPGYLSCLPRVLNNVIEVCEHYEALEFVLPLFQELQGVMNQDALRTLFVPYTH